MSEDPDAVVDHRPDRCVCCGGSQHEDLPAEIVSVSEHIELPEVAPAVTQHRRLAYRGGGPPAGTFDFTPAFYDTNCALRGIPVGLVKQCRSLDMSVRDGAYDRRLN